MNKVKVIKIPLKIVDTGKSICNRNNYMETLISNICAKHIDACKP